MLTIFKKAYKMLRKDLKRKNFFPCVVANLENRLIMNKESDQIYIFFQMTIIRQHGDS